MPVLEDDDDWAMFYLLDGTEVRPVSMDEWLAATTRSQQIAHDQIGDVRVSTLFLGLDHGFGGAPLLFETMIFGGPHHREQERYSSHAEAVAGHAFWLAVVKADAS